MHIYIGFFFLLQSTAITTENSKKYTLFYNPIYFKSRAVAQRNVQCAYRLSVAVNYTHIHFENSTHRCLSTVHNIIDYSLSFRPWFGMLMFGCPFCQVLHQLLDVTQNSSVSNMKCSEIY